MTAPAQHISDDAQSFNWLLNRFASETPGVMEAIAERNRHGGVIEKFIFISSVSAYGPETPGPVDEDFPLAAHTLPYAVHKKDSDAVVRARPRWQTSKIVRRVYVAEEVCS